MKRFINFLEESSTFEKIQKIFVQYGEGQINTEEEFFRLIKDISGKTFTSIEEVKKYLFKNRKQPDQPITAGISGGTTMA